MIAIEITEDTINGYLNKFNNIIKLKRKELEKIRGQKDSMNKDYIVGVASGESFDDGYKLYKQTKELMAELSKYRSLKTLFEMVIDRHYPNHVTIDDLNDGFDISIEHADEGFNYSLKVADATDINYNIYFLPLNEDTDEGAIIKEHKKFIKQKFTQDNIKYIFISTHGTDTLDFHKICERDNTNIQIFHMNHVLQNISKNKIVPKHSVITNESEINNIIDKYKLTSLLQLPKILINDPMSRYLDLNPIIRSSIESKINTNRSIIKIIRNNTRSIDREIYRVCIEDPDVIYNPVALLRINSMRSILGKKRGKSKGKKMGTKGGNSGESKGGVVGGEKRGKGKSKGGGDGVVGESKGVEGGVVGEGVGDGVVGGEKRGKGNSKGGEDGVVGGEMTISDIYNSSQDLSSREWLDQMNRDVFGSSSGSE